MKLEQDAFFADGLAYPVSRTFKKQRHSIDKNICLISRVLTKFYESSYVV